MFITLIAALSVAAAAQEHSQDGQTDTTEIAAPAAGPVLQLDEIEGQSDFLQAPAREYAAYHRVVSGLRDAPIGSGEDLDRAMDRLTSFYGEDRLVRAWIAYSAIIAARHPEYLDEVRELADYYGVQTAVSGLASDPLYATSFVYSDEAEADVIDALEQDSAGIRDVAHRYRMAAYDLQSERWANRVAGDRGERLAMLQSIGQRPIAFSDELEPRLDAGFSNGLPASALFGHALNAPAPQQPGAAPELSLTVGEAVQDPDRQRIGRILSVAALQSLSDDPAAMDQTIQALMTDPMVERCIAWVRLDMQQCIAAGHFKYEDSFCIAEHALLDVSRCLGAGPSAN